MLICWLIYRSQPGPKSKRLISQAIDVLEEDPARARSLLQEAHELTPENDLILGGAGQAAYFAGNHEAAIKYFEEVERRGSIRPQERLMLGHALYQAEEYERALKTVQQISPETPEHTKAVLIAGGAFAEMNEHEAAIEVLKQGPVRKRKLNDELKELHYQLGVNYQAVGDGGKAEKHFRKVYTSDIEYRDVQKRLEELRQK